MANSQDSAFLSSAFGPSTDLDTIAWQEPISSVIDPSWSAVDVVVHVSDPISFSDNQKIGLAWHPAGLVIRGQQSIRQGETRVFENVAVMPGQDLVVALDGDNSVSMEFHAAGTAKVTDLLNTPTPDEPLTAGAKALGGTLGLAIVALIAFHFLTTKGS